MVPQTLLRTEPGEFFHQLLKGAMEKQQVESSADVETYLVGLLTAFVRMDAAAFSKPLALDYLEALTENPTDRFRRLKRVGDNALFLTGVFLDRLERATVGPDYYTALGGSAYGHLAASPLSDLKPLFAELSDRFADFVRVLAQMSLTDIFSSDRDVMRVYRRWLATRGARDAALLVRRGLIPWVPDRPMTQ